MSEPAEKRGPGRPRTRPYEAPATDLPDGGKIVGIFDLKAAVLAAVSKSFPDGELAMKTLDESEDKLSFRRLMGQLKVKVTLKDFAVATMIPADAEQADVDAAMARLRTDKRDIERHISKQYAEPVAPAGTRD